MDGPSLPHRWRSLSGCGVGGPYIQHRPATSRTGEPDVTPMPSKIGDVALRTALSDAALYEVATRHFIRPATACAAGKSDDARVRSRRAQ